MKTGVTQLVIFASLLFVAGVLIVAGVSLLSTSAAWIAAGGLLAVWSWSVLSEVNK